MTEEDRSRQELYEKKQRECSLLEASATKREKEAKYIIDNQNQVLQDKAEKLTQNERTSLKKEFCAKEKKLKRELATERTELHALTLGGLLYSVLATMLTIATTKRFKTDLMAVVDIICGTAVWAWEKTLMMANSALNMCHSIPNEIVATITGYLLGAVVIIAITGGIIAALVYGGYALFKFYNEKYADTMSAVVTLISFALLVWLGDFISDMVTWNLVVVFLMIQAGYICLRRYMEKQ